MISIPNPLAGLRHSVGQAPGTLLPTDGSDQRPLTYEHLHYTQDTFARCSQGNSDQLVIRDTFDRPGVDWVHFRGDPDPAFLERLEEEWGIHRLVLEDIMNTQHRSKMEEYPDYVFFTLRELGGIQADGSMPASTLFSIILKDNVIFTFQRGEPDTLSGLMHRIEQKQGRIRNKGTDYLAFAIMDVLVDNYYPLVDDLTELVETYEAKALDLNKGALETVYLLRSQVGRLHRLLGPIQQVVHALSTNDSNIISEDIEKYFSDLLDHLNHLMSALEGQRERITGLQDFIFNLHAQNMNEIMKTLTIFASVCMPLTVVAGVYGMNFKHIPELEAHNGYFYALGAMGCMVSAALFYFRRKGWW